MDKKVVATNRQAGHFYTILETYEAGIVLEGYEVKSLRSGEINLKDGFIKIETGEAFLYNVHIPQYRFLSHVDYDPTHKRKLLLNKREILKLESHIKTKGLAAIPLEIYFNKRGIAKLALALGKGKKLFDKRESIKKKELSREIRREHKAKFRI